MFLFQYISSLGILPWARWVSLFCKVPLRLNLWLGLSLFLIGLTVKFAPNYLFSILKMGHSRPLFSLFSSFQCTVDRKQMFNINKFLPMTGFEPRTSGIGSDRSTNWATQPLPEKSLSFYVHFDLSLSLSLLFQSILFGLTIKFAPNCLSSIFFRSFWPFSLSLSYFTLFPFPFLPSSVSRF